MVAICVLWQAPATGLADQPVRLMALVTGLGIVTSVVLFAAAEPFLTRLSNRRWLSLLHSIAHSLRSLLLYPSLEGLKLLAVAFLGHILLILAALCLARAYGIPIGLADSLVVFSMVFLVSSIPITPGGWGVREGAMVFALAPFGASIEASIGMSVTYGIFAMAACLPSALLFVAIRDPRLGVEKDKKT
jgi:uncharacterized membrane protein YbhN (UPF0104 family)